MGVCSDVERPYNRKNTSNNNQKKRKINENIQYEKQSSEKELEYQSLPSRKDIKNEYNKKLKNNYPKFDNSSIYVSQENQSDLKESTQFTGADKYTKKYDIKIKQNKEYKIEDKIENKINIDYQSQYQKKESIINFNENKEQEIKTNLDNEKIINLDDNSIKNENINKINDKKFEEDHQEPLYEEFFTNKESNYYDMILNFNSFEQLRKNGWTANFTIEGKKKYDKCINENNIVIGVVGIKNRGKSYLLGRIMDNKDFRLPSGFLVTTYGISCRFPVLNKGDKVFVTLDTAGKDNPLLQNAYYQNNEDVKKIAKDQKISEILLSDFIIQESNILIAVLEQLSFAEQEMLRTLIERLKQKERKEIEKRELIIIHNLMNISTVKEIKQFIDNTLLKSLTFSLEPQSMGKHEKFDDSKSYFYVQNEESQNNNENNEDDNQDNLEIIHLVVGDDLSSEVKESFNEPAFRFIRDKITIDTTRKFDIIESFKNFIIKNSKKFMANNKEFSEDTLYIGREEKRKVYIDKEKKNTIDKIIIPIKYKEKENIEEFNLKSVYIDSNGIHNFINSIETRYSSRIIKNMDKDYLEIIFEMFGKIKEIKNEIDYDNDNNQIIITIKGEIEEIIKINNEKVYGNLKYSQFEFQVKIEQFISNKNINDENKYFEIEIKNEPVKEEDLECGIYTYLFPIKLYPISNIKN